ASRPTCLASCRAWPARAFVSPAWMPPLGKGRIPSGNKPGQGRVCTTGARLTARSAEFERAIGPHLRSAYSLARWLMRGSADADDVLQEAYLRAFRHFDSFRGGNARGWLLSIVRNACWTALSKTPPAQEPLPLDDDRDAPV